MIHAMFDVDGTLIDSYDFDETCYLDAIESVFGRQLDTDWSTYPHITDTGILKHFLESIGRDNELVDLIPPVKSVFLENIRHHLAECPARQIQGAGQFLTQLNHHPNIEVSIATGGWKETALCKLSSAKISIKGIPMATSNDHFSRTKIMHASARKLSKKDFKRRIYFGDAQWDKQACELLGYEFIAVGEKVAHHTKIDNYAQSADLIELITA